jgi:hypothetical protein
LCGTTWSRQYRVTQNVYGKSYWEGRVDAVIPAAEAVSYAAQNAEKKNQPDTLPSFSGALWLYVFCAGDICKSAARYPLNGIHSQAVPPSSCVQVKADRVGNRSHAEAEELRIKP